MKTGTFIKQLKISEQNPQGSVVECVNLTELPLTEDGVGGLVPVAGLRTDVSVPLVPLAEAVTPSGQELLLLTASQPDDSGRWPLCVREGATVVRVGESASRPCCAVSITDGWLVMAETGRLEVVRRASGEWDVSAESASAPRLSVRAVRQGTVTQRIEAQTLTDVDFSRETASIGAKGLKSLTGSLLEAYGSLNVKASESGAWIQPMVARCHLLDAEGRRIYSSEPMLAAAGWQCCEPVEVVCAKDGAQLQVPAFVIEASVYSLEVEVGNLGAFASLAKSVEVCVTPPLHPVDFNGDAPYRIVRPSTAAPQLTVALPGATASLADASARHSARLSGVVDRIDLAESLVATLSASATTRVVTNDAVADASAQVRMVDSLLGKPVAADRGGSAKLLDLIAAPHSFTARCVATGGDSVVWGDVTPLPGAVALPRGEEEVAGAVWTGSVRVTMADGVQLLTAVGSPMPMPQTLPPMLSYPSGQAVRFEMWVEDEAKGTVGYADVTLSATADGKRAVWFDKSLTPLQLSVWNGGDYPKADDGVRPMGKRVPGAVVSARTSLPGSAEGAVEITKGPVVSVMPSVKSQSSWDFTRIRVYAFSPSGIYALAVGSDRRTLSSSLIDPRGVSRACRVAYTSCGVAVATDCGGVLLVSGSRTSRLQLPESVAVGVVALGWDVTTDRLWALGSEGSIAAIDLASGSWHSVELTEPPSMIHSLGRRLWVRCGERLLTVGGNTDGATMVRWRVRVPIAQVVALRALEVAMAASRFRGRVSLRTDGGAGTAESLPLVTLSVEGQLNAPLRSRLAVRARRFLILEIEGEVSDDFVITDVSVLIEKIKLS